MAAESGGSRPSHGTSPPRHERRRPGPARTWDSGTASVYRRRDKKLLWSANVPDYPHIIERAPGTGAAVVADRGKGPGGGDARGGSLHVLRSTGGHSGSLVRAGAPIPFHQAHGLLRDPRRERMWAAGGSGLGAYRIVMTASSARPVEDAARRLTGFHHPHGLQPDHQHPGRLLVTGTGGVYAVAPRRCGGRPCAHAGR
ncbi:hypothetical protein ACWDY4_08885 [Streptomyces olivaceoviridis]